MDEVMYGFPPNEPQLETCDKVAQPKEVILRENICESEFNYAEFIQKGMELLLNDPIKVMTSITTY